MQWASHFGLAPKIYVIVNFFPVNSIRSRIVSCKSRFLHLEVGNFPGKIIA